MRPCRGQGARGECERRASLEPLEGQKSSKRQSQLQGAKPSGSHSEGLKGARAAPGRVWRLPGFPGRSRKRQDHKVAVLHNKLCRVTLGQVERREVPLSTRTLLPQTAVRATTQRRRGQGTPRGEGDQRGGLCVRVVSLSSRVGRRGQTAPKGNHDSGSFYSHSVCHTNGCIYD